MSGRILLESDPPQQQPEETPAPAPAPETPAPPPPDSEPAPAKEADAPPAETGPPPDWKMRIDRLTREKYEARRQVEEYQRQIQQAQERARQTQTPAGQGDARAEALQQFRAEAAEREFNAACNEVFRKGSADYTDFGDAVSALNAVGYGSRPDALAAISAMPDGHHVYRALAQDLDNAARVLALPPMHMAMEFARMAHAHGSSQNGAAPPPPAAVTRAPAPLRPVGGNSARPEKPLDQVSIGEFIRRRDRDTIGSSRIRR